ncbi:MAG TPA: ABC-F family ATP-binding cassette domain-containing protein [Negativicutes bacterium]|nr:ABC-F family ATP-binding cassette domain-containing protein [Negativicutes bacterium]
MANETILRFNNVSFEYTASKKILDEVDFSVRKGAKITIMGQNRAGKSTIFQLMAGGLSPESGSVNVGQNITIALARQAVLADQMDLTLREFFQKSLNEAASAKASASQRKIYDIDPKIDAVLEAVNLTADHEKKIKSFSGGQQARILLASALIQDSDLLLLDEPTNNLDKEGIAHLTKFLVQYKKTVVVISHDSDFLNAFTDGVLYLDVHTKKVQWYQGNYYDVLDQVAAQIEKEASQNARLSKSITDKKEKANYFDNKGGRLRLLAARMREAAEEMEDNKVESRKDDKTIRQFTIPAQEGTGGELLKITSLTVIKNHQPKNIKANISLYKNQHLLISGPNGIGKSTLLESLVTGNAKGASIAPGVVVGYYKQDFSTLNVDETVYRAFSKVAGGLDEQSLRAMAAGFLISNDVLFSKIGSLSEGQKGLVMLMKLTLLKPGLLILDEPTNHINFRHLPVIAKALDEYKGAMVLVSHVPEFVAKIRIDETLELKA